MVLTKNMHDGKFKGSILASLWCTVCSRLLVRTYVGEAKREHYTHLLARESFLPVGPVVYIISNSLSIAREEIVPWAPHSTSE